MNTHELAGRIAQLETSNRRLKLFGGLGLGLVLVGFAAPTMCDVVTGERLVLRDESNKTRITMDAYRTESPALSFTNKAGRTVGSLTVSEDGIASLTLMDSKGKVRGTYTWGDEPVTPTQPAPKKADVTTMAR